MGTPPDPAQFVRHVGKPWLFKLVGRSATAYELAWRLALEGTVTRMLRGSKMMRIAALYDEVGAALQFPDYFGENPAALDECVTDLSWLPGPAYVLLVIDSHLVLWDEPADRFAMFVDILVGAAEEWAEPVRLGEAWDRDSVPFHVGFHTPREFEARLDARFAALGRDLTLRTEL
jgi:Barstar (barnase inhibitor)